MNQCKQFSDVPDKHPEDHHGHDNMNEGQRGEDVRLYALLHSTNLEPEALRKFLIIAKRKSHLT